MPPALSRFQGRTCTTSIIPGHKSFDAIRFLSQRASVDLRTACRGLRGEPHELFRRGPDSQPGRSAPSLPMSGHVRRRDLDRRHVDVGDEEQRVAPERLVAPPARSPGRDGRTPAHLRSRDRFQGERRARRVCARYSAQISRWPRTEVAPSSCSIQATSSLVPSCATVELRICALLPSGREKTCS